MATATQTQPTATKTAPLTCPACLDGEAEVVMLVDRPAGLCRCLGCEEEFTPAEAASRFAELARKWQRVAAWVERAPDLG